MTRNPVKNPKRSIFVNPYRILLVISFNSRENLTNSCYLSNLLPSFDLKRVIQFYGLYKQSETCIIQNSDALQAGALGELRHGLWKCQEDHMQEFVQCYLSHEAVFNFR